MALIINCLVFYLFFVKTSALPDVEDLTVYNYHLQTGIPTAAKMMVEVAKDIVADNLNKIIGGYITDIRAVPYQAGLVIKVLHLFTSVCGGSLISRTRVLTAAHCVDDGRTTAQDITVVLGSNHIFSGGVRCEADGSVVHADWDPETIANDVAIIFIAPVNFTDVIQPISLPSFSELDDKFIGWSALASGYGLTNDKGTITYSQKISSVMVSIIPNQICAKVYGDIIRPSTICTDSSDRTGTCKGDSGGPLVVTSRGRKILIGITSFGARAGCEQGYPEAFTRVTSYLHWIKTI